MTRRTLRSQSGFTYIAALVMVVIMGIMLGKAAVVWTTKMKQEREIELIFRGSQIRVAIQRWYKFIQPIPGQAAPPPPATASPPLMDLKDLLKDPNNSGTMRYLRPAMLIDPITKKEWGVIKDGTRIIGVKSTSDEEPLKKGNFPDDFPDFEGKLKYSEWEFVYNRLPQRGASAGGVRLPEGQPPTPQPQPPQH
jgi:type II secretory pathway pseudopilin PulG